MSDPLHFSGSPFLDRPRVTSSASKALTLICSQLLVYSLSLTGDIDHSRIGSDKNLPLDRLSLRLSTVNSNRSIGLKRLVRVGTRQSSNNDVTRRKRTPGNCCNISMKEERGTSTRGLDDFRRLFSFVAAEEN